MHTVIVLENSIDQKNKMEKKKPELGFASVVRDTLDDVDPSTEDAESPRDGEQHDGGSRQSADADSELVLRVRTQPGEQNDRTVGHRTFVKMNDENDEKKRKETT